MLHTALSSTESRSAHKKRQHGGARLNFRCSSPTRVTFLNPILGILPVFRGTFLIISEPVFLTIKNVFNSRVNTAFHCRTASNCRPVLTHPSPSKEHFCSRCFAMLHTMIVPLLGRKNEKNRAERRKIMGRDTQRRPSRL